MQRVCLRFARRRAEERRRLSIGDTITAHARPATAHCSAAVAMPALQQGMAESDGPSANKSQMDPALASTIFARLHPATYLHRFLSAGLRPDGRAFDDRRETRIGSNSIQVAQGSCVVRHGSTMMVAGVRAELLDISDEDAGEGEELEGDEEAGDDVAFPSSSDKSAAEKKQRQRLGLGPVERRRVIVGVDLGPMASPRFKPGPPGQEAQLLASRLQRTLEVCAPIDAADLVIEERLMSWCLYIDVVCVAYDGNAFDAALLAINGALQDTRLPQTAFDPSREQYISSPNRSLESPLSLTCCPVAMSFAIVDGEYLLADPNAFEMTLASGSITVTLDATRLGKRRDLVDVQVTGRCEACVALSTAMQHGISKDQMEEVSNGASDQQRVRIRDEALILYCLEIARKEAATMKESLLKAQRPLVQDDVSFATE